MTGVILAIDLGKAKSLFCWHQTSDQTQRLKTISSTPQAFAEALAEQKVDRVVIEVYDMAGWVCDLCRARGIEIQVANANGGPGNGTDQETGQVQFLDGPENGTGPIP